MNQNQLGGSQPQPTMPTNNNGIGNMLKQFKQFKQLMSGKDPKAAVIQLLTNGQMSQEQFSELKQMAKDFSGLLK